MDKPKLLLMNFEEDVFGAEEDESAPEEGPLPPFAGKLDLDEFSDAQRTCLLQALSCIRNPNRIPEGKVRAARLLPAEMLLEEYGKISPVAALRFHAHIDFSLISEGEAASREVTLRLAAVLRVLRFLKPAS